jgi:ferredoxin
MRIVADLNRCQGYAQCVPLAPDVLKPARSGGARLRPTPTIRSANEYCAR